MIDWPGWRETCPLADSVHEELTRGMAQSFTEARQTGVPIITNSHVATLRTISLLSLVPEEKALYPVAIARGAGVALYAAASDGDVDLESPGVRSCSSRRRKASAHC